MVGTRFRYCAEMIWSVSMLSRTTKTGPVKTDFVMAKVCGGAGEFSITFLPADCADFRRSKLNLHGTAQSAGKFPAVATIRKIPKLPDKLNGCAQNSICPCGCRRSDC